ncbi:MAG TPA: response regulator [Chthoniobacteraceae bacterium]|jgi:CheY-like chemotaxis protein|nr:response regulator [Chthoniobacteraceae bacterium]
MRVLVADDDRDMAEVIASYVRELDHEVVETVTGGGLSVIQSFARHRPDVVLLDIMMPRFNGLTVCHALLSRDPNAKVVFVSGHVEGTHPFVSNAGAIGYLEKPIQREKLREILDAVAA